MNIVTISDLHCGCRLGLLPPEPVQLAHGLETKQNRLQKKLWRIWMEYWEWVHRNFADEECVLVVNGDAIDGDHHGSKKRIHASVPRQRKAESVVSRLCGETRKGIGVIIHVPKTPGRPQGQRASPRGEEGRRRAGRASGAVA